MYTFMITKDKRSKTKHLLTHIPDPAKGTLVSTFFKNLQNSGSESSNLKGYTSSV